MSTPNHILIIGAGEFGLSTCLSLLSRPNYFPSSSTRSSSTTSSTTTTTTTTTTTKITILDSSPVLPNPSGSSVDANRIIRSDYAYRHYAVLASKAQVHWRDRSDEGWGGQGRYTETGYVLGFDSSQSKYVRKAFENVKNLAANDKKGENGTSDCIDLDVNKIVELPDREAVKRASGGCYEGVGDAGYANYNSGWAHAEKTVEYALRKIKETGGDRVVIRPGAKVDRLIFDGGECDSPEKEDSKSRCVGVALDDGEEIRADLTIVAAGAWSPTLVDLRGRCLATGQVLAFYQITPEEEARLRDTPVVMNFSNGTFIIPPRDGVLKIARHAYGYVNPTDSTRFGAGVSVPRVGVASIPPEGERACAQAWRDMLPDLAPRPAVRTRICWYCDTPTGDFLVDFHPDHRDLFVATGGSGHGFKFFPVIGDQIVDRIEGKLDPELVHLWRWKPADPDFKGCKDGSRAGVEGLILDDLYKER